MSDARVSVAAFRGLCAALSVAVLLSSAPPAAAEPPPAPRPAVAPVAPGPRKATAAERDAARTLALQGFEQLQQGKLDAAVALFLQAEEHFHAPTHQMYLAQAYEKKGLLLRAAAAYRNVLDEALPRDAPQPFLDARAEAAPALERLLRRIPRLRVEVTGVAPALVQLSIRDHAVLPGVAAEHDPGTYRISATAAGAVPAERTVELGDGGGEVVVRFELARPISIAWPIAAFGVGLAAGGVAVTTGVLSYNQSRRFESACSKGLDCPVIDLRTMQDAARLRDVAIATGIVSGLALAAGLTLLLVHPTSKTAVEPEAASPSARRPAATVALRLGPGFTGLTGTF